MNTRSFLIVCAGCIFGSIACRQHPSAETITARKDSSTHIQRFGMVTGLKKEKMEYYKQLHAAAWPAVQHKISECNIRNYSIYMKEIKGELFLFSYFEYTGTDFDGDMKKMAADTATRRWWRETDPCQQPLPDAAAKNKIWSPMEEVFYQE